MNGPQQPFWQPFILFLFLACGVYFFLKNRKQAPTNDAWVCTSCGSMTAKTKTPGSFGIEVVLWLCMIIPGLIYSLWRLSRRRLSCGACESDTLVPSNSPVGLKLRKELESSNT